ncbi:MAG: hypothetical protein WDN72_09950 [Alphaproteobacteria bacterium]
MAINLTFDPSKLDLAAVQTAAAPAQALIEAAKVKQAFTTSQATVYKLADDSTFLVNRHTGDLTVTSPQGNHQVPAWNAAANVRDWVRQSTPASLADLSNLTALTLAQLNQSKARRSRRPLTLPRT